MSNTLKLSKSHVERGLAANPQFRKYEDKLRSMDKNQDGEIDIAELCQVLDEMSIIEKHRKLLKGACYVMAVFSLLTIAAIVGLTYAVVDLTKDSQVSSSSILVTKDSAANPIATGQAISLDDASQLFNKNLNELSDLEFLIIPSEIGGTVVHVAEVELVANSSAKVTTTAGTVYEIDASGIHLVNTTAGGRRKLLQTSGGATTGSTSSGRSTKTVPDFVNNRLVGPNNGFYCNYYCSSGDPNYRNYAYFGSDPRYTCFLPCNCPSGSCVRSGGDDARGGDSYRGSSCQCPYGGGSYVPSTAPSGPSSGTCGPNVYCPKSGATAEYCDSSCSSDCGSTSCYCKCP